VTGWPPEPSRLQTGSEPVAFSRKLESAGSAAAVTFTVSGNNFRVRDLRRHHVGWMQQGCRVYVQLWFESLKVGFLGGTLSISGEGAEQSSPFRQTPSTVTPGEEDADFNGSVIAGGDLDRVRQSCFCPACDMLVHA